MTTSEDKKTDSNNECLVLVESYWYTSSVACLFWEYVLQLWLASCIFIFSHCTLAIKKATTARFYVYGVRPNMTTGTSLCLIHNYQTFAKMGFVLRIITSMRL